MAVTKFRNYLRINTEQPNPDYCKILVKIVQYNIRISDKCRDFLFAYASELGLQSWEYEVSKNQVKASLFKTQKFLK